MTVVHSDLPGTASNGRRLELQAEERREYVTLVEAIWRAVGEEMRRKGLDDQDIAVRCCVSPRTLRSKRAQGVMSLDLLYKLCRVLDLDLILVNDQGDNLT